MITAFADLINGVDDEMKEKISEIDVVYDNLQNVTKKFLRGSSMLRLVVVKEWINNGRNAHNWLYEHDINEKCDYDPAWTTFSYEFAELLEEKERMLQAELLRRKK